MTDARLAEVEAKLAFAEDLLDSLNEIVARQQGQIDLLQEQLRLLNRRMQEMAEANAGPPAQERPPHY